MFIEAVDMDGGEGGSRGGRERAKRREEEKEGGRGGTGKRKRCFVSPGLALAKSLWWVGG